MAPRKNRRGNIDPRKLYIIKQIVLGVALLILIGGIVTGVWYGTRIESLTIDRVEVVGGITIEQEVVRQAAEQELEGTYYRLIPKRFAWTYPKEDIISAVEAIDRVKEARLTRTDGQALIVAFDEYIPEALWCREPDSTDCYFIDKAGFAFSKAPQLTGGSFVRYVTLNEDPVADRPVVERAVLEKTNQFIEMLKEQFGFYVTVIELDSAGDVFYTLAGGGELKVTLSDEPTAVIDNLATILGSDAFSHLTPEEFAYIDLRFGNKVYVNEEGESETVSSSTEAELLESTE